MSPRRSKFKLKCLSCGWVKYGPYLTISVMGTDHSLKKKHHVRIHDPSGLLISDMDVPGFSREFSEVPPY